MTPANFVLCASPLTHAASMWPYMPPLKAGVICPGNRACGAIPLSHGKITATDISETSILERVAISLIDHRCRLHVTQRAVMAWRKMSVGNAMKLHSDRSRCILFLVSSFVVWRTGVLVEAGCHQPAALTVNSVVTGN